MDSERIEKLKKALQEIGITSEEDLCRAIKELPPLNISIMTQTVVTKIAS